MQQQAELDYISMNDRKTVKYNDMYSFFTSNVSGTQSVLITNGIANMQEILVCPFITSGSNNSFSTYQSPFASEPSTLSPLGGPAFSQFNVQLSGQNVYMNNLQYDFESFLEELAPGTGVNGLEMTGVCSGLISYQDWQMNYGYYYVDVSRRLKENDKLPVSVQLLFTTNTVVGLDLITFITYERELTFEIATGKILDVYYIRT
jgi:hypothetical protein